MKISWLKVFSRSVLALVLVSIVIWQYENFQAEQEKQEAEVKIALKKIGEHIEEESACFFLKKQIELKAGEGIIMLRSSEDGFDTLGEFMGYSGEHSHPYDDPHIQFDALTKLEMNMRIEFQKALENSKQSDFQNWVDSSLVNSITDSVQGVRFGDHQSIQEAFAEEFTETQLKQLDWRISSSSKRYVVASTGSWMNKIELGSVELFQDRRLQDNEKYTLTLFATSSFLPLQYFMRWEFWIAIFIFILSCFLLWSIEKNIKRERESNALQVSMMNHLSHEFNTQLAKILLATEGLKNMDDDPVRESRYLDIVERGSKELSASLKSFMSNGKVNSDAYRDQHDEFDLSQLVREVGESFSAHQLNGSKHLELKVEEAVVVKGNQYHLKRVLLNLLSNGVKYGGNRLKVNLNAIDEFVRVEVQDNGEGVPAGKLKQLFAPYFRYNRNIANGFGIGLSYCQSVILAHGGEISAEVEESTGFNVSFKLKRA